MRQSWLKATVPVWRLNVPRLPVGVLVLVGLTAGSAAVLRADPGSGRGEQPSGIEGLDFRAVVRDAKSKVFPAVVYIKCIRDTHEQGKKVSEEVGGSGVMTTPGGEVVTNWHVIDKAVEVRCLLMDGRAFDARVLGSDKDTDLGLLQLQVPPDSAPLPCAVFGDSKILTEGDFVMAMGAPWGMSRSVSIGIVSCTRRFLPESSEYSLWLQTDASISPGNSGGPLVNTAGEVIGINARATTHGGDLGFAIPAETVQRIVTQLRASGHADWSWTGLQLQPLRDFDRNIYFDAEDGVVVAGTDPESPARRAGIQPKDRIIAVNGHPVTARVHEDLPAVRCRLGLLPKGEPARLELVRGETLHTLELTPLEKGKVEGDELDCPRWDLTVKTINKFDNPDLHFQRPQGVFIYGIKYPGNAASAGLRRGDIVLKIDDTEVATLDQVREAHAAALANVATRHRVLFTVLRSGLERQIVLDFARDYEKH